MISSKIKASIKDIALKFIIKDRSIHFPYQCASSLSCEPITAVLKPGKYKFELWGAQGGDARYCNSVTLRTDSGGKGAYVSGQITLKQESTFLFYIGGKGEDQSSYSKNAYGRGGFNGGGNGGYDSADGGGSNDTPESSAGGGGATDVRLLLGDSIVALKSRIIVAAGGGGSCSTDYSQDNKRDYKAGEGGTLEGFSYNNIMVPGGFNTGTFGKGDNGATIYDGSTGGCGSGFFGGKNTYSSSIGAVEIGGAGGSSYVSGYKGCYSPTLDNNDTISLSPDSRHYSGFIFRNIRMKSGRDIMNLPLSESTSTGHSSNGDIVITYISSSLICTQSLRNRMSIIFTAFTMICTV